MNASTPLTIPARGTFLPEQGGYFHGLYQLGSQLVGEVTGPKAECTVKGVVWHPDYIDIPGATSDFDGLANTLAMAEAGSPLAQAALACRAGGLDGWYVPARGGQLLQWGARLDLPEDEAFEPRWHWSSTQYSRNLAFYQYFDDGRTTADLKDWEHGCARFVRRFLIQSLNP